jgi:hypothetical protein
MAKPISRIIDDAATVNDASIEFALEYPSATNAQKDEFKRLSKRKWSTAPSSRTPSNRSSSSSSGGITGSIAGGIQRVYQSHIGQEDRSMNPDVTNDMLEIIKGNGVSLQTVFETAKKTQDYILDQLKAESELRSEINSRTNLTEHLSSQLREDLIESSIYAAKYGFDMSNLSDLYTELVESTGKFSLLNKETFDKAAPVVKAFGTTMAALAGTMVEFEKVGIGANRTIDMIEVAGIKSIQLGLSGKKTVKDIESNISKLNEYGFKNGVEGLATMVRKSQEFRISMDSVFRIADKVMSPEGALELTANLQVLGGAIGDFNDPLKMMYDSTNNVEGLQDALIGAAGGLATYNKEQGRFEITGVNLRRAKEMAAQLGVSYDELAKGAIAAAERSSAASDLLATGLQMSDTDKEFLTNISGMENGQMMIKVPESLKGELGLGEDGKLALADLTEKQKDYLLKNQKAFETMTADKIAMAQLTEVQEISQNLRVIAAGGKRRGLQAEQKIVKGVSSVLGITPVVESAGDAIKKEADTYKVGRPNYDLEIQRQTEGVINKIGEYIPDWVKRLISMNENNTNKTDNTTINNNTQSEAIVNNTNIKDQVRDGFVEALTMTKYNSKNNITVENNVDYLNPKGYFSNDV